jgi:hypothetical protein
LKLPYLEKEHPLARKLKLMVCKLSGIPSDSEAFRNKLPIFSCLPGSGEPKESTFILQWFQYCNKGKIASISPSLKEVI